MIFECKDLNLVYDEGKEVQTYALRNINLSIEKNKLIGIIGPSGSGKSSLLYCLSGLKIPTNGAVYYNELNLKTLPDNERSKLRKDKFGFIFQKHFLIDYMTVLENVLVVVNDNSTENKEKALTILESLGIRKLSDKKPFQLSGGQSQRVAIARALMNNPQVIFADELTASLDHESAKEVMKVLESLREKTTVIVVTHDESILNNVDDIIHIWDGSIKSIDNKILR